MNSPHDSINGAAVDARPPAKAPAPKPLTSLNTHGVAIGGVVLIAIGLVIHIAAKWADAPHLEATSLARIALDQLDTYIAVPILAGGFGAYYGRPHTVAS